MNEDISITRVPVIDANRCRQCDACIEACPLHVISVSTSNTCAKCVKYCMTMEVPCSPEYLVFDYDKCDACGRCVTACPHEAIYWVTPKTGESRGPA